MLYSCILPNCITRYLLDNKQEEKKSTSLAAKATRWCISSPLISLPMKKQKSESLATYKPSETTIQNRGYPLIMPNALVKFRITKSQPCILIYAELAISLVVILFLYLP